MADGDDFCGFLVKDRGYQVADEEINMSLADFKAQYANNWRHCRIPSNQIFIFFSDEKSVGVKTMRKLLNILEEKNIAKGIIIFPGTMTSSARKVISAMQARFRLEEFAEADLLVNITHHKLVPRHEILDSEQKRLLLERYRLKETQLPRIQLADPIARYYGLRRGQVVKITRPSETSGRYASYRVCF
ncbi:DNA-directed RNA polymerase RPB5 subunit [Russula earlei]|uniref:DNA-directed RNA polymerase RPB5 subunit n=1 Tax=Russula earlei TaxID=71964 RepID=A0ACC0UQ81_9AGAM|nr:DNA-directed RNA polymerase RPB5 subunit [Russula earlei]